MMKCWWVETERTKTGGSRQSIQQGPQGREGVGTQRPRLKEHIRTMEAVLSILMGGKAARVGVEAGTHEGLGTAGWENFSCLTAIIFCEVYGEVT